MPKHVQPLDVTNGMLGAIMFVGAEKYLPKRITLGQTIHLASLWVLMDAEGSTLPDEQTWLAGIAKKLEQVLEEGDWVSKHRADMQRVGLKYILERAAKEDTISHAGYRKFYEQFVEAYKAGLRDSGLIMQRIACWAEEQDLPFPNLGMKDD